MCVHFIWLRSNGMVGRCKHLISEALANKQTGVTLALHWPSLAACLGIAPAQILLCSFFCCSQANFWPDEIAWVVALELLCFGIWHTNNQIYVVAPMLRQVIRSNILFILWKRSINGSLPNGGFVSLLPNFQEAKKMESAWVCARSHVKHIHTMTIENLNKLHSRLSLFTKLFRLCYLTI